MKKIVCLLATIVIVISGVTMGYCDCNLHAYPETPQAAVAYVQAATHYVPQPNPGDTQVTVGATTGVMITPTIQVATGDVGSSGFLILYIYAPAINYGVNIPGRQVTLGSIQFIDLLPNPFNFSNAAGLNFIVYYGYVNGNGTIMYNAYTVNVVGCTQTGSLKVGVDMDICNSVEITGPAIYVSPNGNDSAAGTISSPLKTVYAAIQAADAGTTVVLRGGTYNETHELRIRVPNITITSYPGEWAVINRNTGASEDMGIYFYVGSNGSKLQCVEVSGGFYTVSTETMWDWGEADRSGASNITIENTKLHDSYRDVIKIKPQSDDITISHNEIYNSSNGQMDGECNAEGIDNVNGDRTHISYNHIHNTCSTGVYLKGGATDGIVENNLIEDTGGAGIILGFDTSPEFFDLATNPDYYENIRGIARHNLIRNTGWAGIALYASKDAEVYNNTIVNTASIYHSPIYFGITFQDWEPEAGRPANFNPSIHHNIVSQSAERDAYMVGIRQSDELGGLSSLEGATGLDNNCYYQASRPATYQDGRTNWTGNFTDWQTHTSAESNSHEVDPGLDSNYKPTNPVCNGMGY